MAPPIKSRLASTKTIISALGTAAATAMVVRTISQDYLPSEIQDYINYGLKKFVRYFSTEVTMVINEYVGYGNNAIYDAALVYLESKIASNTSRLRVSKPEEENNLSLGMEHNEEVLDIFNGVQFNWTWVRIVRAPSLYNHKTESRYFELSFNRKHADEALKCYLPFILKEAKVQKQVNRTLKLFTIDDDKTWESVVLDHPSTFETLAMDTELKETVIRDLDMFLKRREKYRKIGKAWKRGYLLYGPPGTGKSSLIAAMANYLKFNIYDLELTDLKCNSELRKLLIETENRSILVVEDIDCSIELHERVSGAKAGKSADKKSKGERASKVTLSGFLNFIDGLWSSCGDERIIIFTTNHKEKLDPALLRPGRMDMHIHMSYCTPCGFRILANNYLEVEDHKLFGEIEELIRTTEVTPAEVAEQLLQSDDPDVSLASLISFLHSKRKNNEEAKNKTKDKKATEEVAESVSQEDDEDDKDNDSDDEDDDNDE
ncbi:Protein hyper-sensitivity-related 4 [Heracleum sosnowskyi]|uniref:Protein hyper-sensitivity-related 4 n=1 Tax=Heracleum sosnowskyi TaxID=360622 RepID=A0AAD8M7I1_9APIA|nr:Protein hyper-sensitivity-related 4 [Heracleum sosnowskyi]